MIKLIFPLFLPLIVLSQTIEKVNSAGGVEYLSSAGRIVQVDTAASELVYGFEFPANTDSPDTMIAFQFDNPQSDGLPLFGPDTAGITVIWEAYFYYQIGYYSVIWWANDGAAYWNEGAADYYWGCNPWPQGGAEGTDHFFEIAGITTDSDNTITRAGGSLPSGGAAVPDSVWLFQAFKAHYNGDSTYRCIFYTDLTDTSDTKVLEYESTDAFDDTLPPAPALTWGENPWWNIHGHERMNGILGRIKMIDTVMTTADIITESNDMSGLQTTVATDNIWYGIQSFEHVDSLTCDYGTGRAFQWTSKTKATKVEISP